MPENTWWRRYWRSLGFGREVAEELTFHVEMLTKDLIAEGMEPERAAREAVRRFGDRTRVQSQLERIERRRGGRLRLTLWLEELWQDLRLGVRNLWKRPGFTVAAVTSLGLGIGTATVVISIVDEWLLKPLPVERPGELVVIGARGRALGTLIIPDVSLPTVDDIRAKKDLFQDVAAWHVQNASMRRPSAQQAELGWLTVATPNYFSMLGVNAEFGRTFTVDDGRERAPVLVLNHEFWRTKLNGDRAVIGQTLLLNGTPFTMIGVLPADFMGTEHLLPSVGFLTTSAEGWLEPSFRDNETRREFGGYQAIARRRPEVSLGSIRSGLAVLSDRLGKEYPTLLDNYQLVAYPERQARPSISSADRMPMVTGLMGALALLVLGTAAVNVANLILARSSARKEELTVRLALGASRWRLIRQMLAESMLLGGVSFVLAFGLAKVAVNAIGSTRIAMPFPLAITFGTGGRVMLMSLVASLAAGALAGFGPALVATRESIQATLRRGGRGGGTGGGRLRGGLIVAQVAAAVMTLVTAGLLAQSGRRAAQVDLGFQPAGIMTTLINAGQAHLDGIKSRAAYDRIRRDIEAIPGVTAVTYGSGIPLSGSGWSLTNVYLDRDNAAAARDGSVSVVTVNVQANYFDLLGVPLRSGRGFTVEDDTSTKAVAVVNEVAAETLWPNENPIGRMLRPSPNAAPVEVVGVVGNGRYFFIGESYRPAVYLSFEQQRPTFAALFVKTRLDPRTVEAHVRESIGRVDPNLAPAQFETLEALVSNGINGLFLLKAGAFLAAAIGGLALVLTVVGLHGMLSFSVSQEVREIGLRMALGAEPGRIVRRILGRGNRLVAVGLVLGLGLALALTRPMAGLLIGGRTTDVKVYGTVAILLVAITTAAAYLPARRASRLDPVKALRTER